MSFEQKTFKEYSSEISKTVTDKRLKKIWSDMQHCERCPLSKLDKNKIRPYGRMGDKFDTLIVGQNPSWSRPDEFIKVYGGLDSLRNFEEIRDYIENEVYLTNLIKCSFEDNVVPDNVDDIAVSCSFYLQKEINAVGPKKIIVLGRIACDFFGVDFDEKGEHRGINVYGLYHPSYIARRGKDEEYMKKLKEVLGIDDSE